MEKFVGNIGIIGKPNVGKSSLLNAIAKQKVSIVNQKPQTTRNKINYLFENELFSINFIDTPGFHNGKNKLDKFINNEILKSIKKMELIYFLIDPTRLIDDEDLKLLESIKKVDIPKILVITKFDLIKLNSDFNIENILKTLDYKFDEVVTVSSLDEISLVNLLSISQKFLSKTTIDELLDNSSIQDDLFLVREIIREQCLTLLQQEIPYGIAISIDEYNYNTDKNLFSINASIIVEKESHRKIVIGLNGSMIKKISMLSRLELSKIFDSNIYLKIFVKSSNNWRNNETKLKEFGYWH